MLLPLTENQEKIFRDICLFIDDKEYPPTISELQNRLKINNPGTIHKCFKALERKGYILKFERAHRGIDLTTEARRKYLQ